MSAAGQCGAEPKPLGWLTGTREVPCRQISVSSSDIDVWKSAAQMHDILYFNTPVTSLGYSLLTNVLHSYTSWYRINASVRASRLLFHYDVSLLIGSANTLPLPTCRLKLVHRSAVSVDRSVLKSLPPSAPLALSTTRPTNTYLLTSKPPPFTFSRLP